MNARPFRTIPELLAYTSQVHASTLALKFRSGLRLEKYLYGELAEQVGRMAQLLTERGITRSDRILLWAANSPSWVIACLGIHGLGAVVVPLDVRTAPELVRKIAAQTEPRLAIVGRAMVPSINSLPHLVIEELSIELARCVACNDEARVNPDDLAEIMYTSGTTGTPKGVMLTHRNLTANVEMALAVMPIRPGFRVLSILPLSHMYEQIVDLIVPLANGASIVYLPSRQLNILLQTLQREKINAMALVPQALSLIMKSIERQLAERGLGGAWRTLNHVAPKLPRLACRVLFWPVHRHLGGHLEFIMSGGAALPNDIEQKWENLGIPILQGYGASEATALVSANLPKEHRRGTVGRPVPGIELQIAEDGEILLRGENVFHGYWQNPAATREALVSGWYHSGDLGQLDADGFIYFRGRKKNLIVLADGQKVHAEDVEEALRDRAGIRDAIVVGLPTVDRVEVHAVILAAPGEEDAIARSIREVNEQLALNQQIRGFTIWQEEDFPRTLTLKVKRHEVMREILREPARTLKSPAAPPPAARGDARSVVARYLKVPVEAVLPLQRLVRDLGLDSLAMVELLFLIEEETGVRVIEQQLPAEATVADLDNLIAQPGDKNPTFKFHFSYWPLHPMVAAARDILQRVLFHPLLSVFGGVRVEGSERLEKISSPCFVIGNHASHFDTVVVVRALPPRLRRRIAVGAAADYWFDNPITGFLAGICYNIYPLVRGGSAGPSLEHTVELVDRGWSILIFPEGTRSRDGTLQPFRSGIGLLAAETGIPVIPLRIEGTHEILPKGGRRPRRGAVKITIGEPISYPLGSDAFSVTRDLEARVKNL